jgi:hypothetical protein
MQVPDPAIKWAAGSLAAVVVSVSGFLGNHVWGQVQDNTRELDRRKPVIERAEEEGREAQRWRGEVEGRLGGIEANLDGVNDNLKRVLDNLEGRRRGRGD